MELIIGKYKIKNLFKRKWKYLYIKIDFNFRDLDYIICVFYKVII